MPGGGAAVPAHARNFGKYRLITRLATGGMAEIFLARLSGAAGFQKHLVLKRILPQYAEDDHFIDMFLDEARIAARISHPNVCQVFELGEVDGQYFLTMEYLDGVPLSSLLREASQDARAGDLRLIVSLAVQACEGLHHAHELRDDEGHPIGLVHRDVSPQNLFVTVDGIVKLLDFGVAKARGASSRTRTGSVKGKYAYMSPEQLKGEPIDRRADIFSLGIVLFEMITLRRLFWRNTDFLIFRAICDEEVPNLQALRPDAPAALSNAVMRALSRDKEHRFPTARALGEALVEAIAPLGGPMSQAQVAAEVQVLMSDEVIERRAMIARALSTVSVTGEHQLPEIIEAPTVASVPSAMPPPRSRKALWATLATLLVGAAIGATVALTRKPAPQPIIVPSAPPPMTVRQLEQEPAAMPKPADPPAPAPKPEPTRPKVVVVHRPPPAPTAPGFVSIDSKPYATIYIDGKNVGETPLFKLAVPPGKHRVRAASSAGPTQSFDIHVQSGKEAPPRRLVW